LPPPLCNHERNRSSRLLALMFAGVSCLLARASSQKASRKAVSISRRFTNNIIPAHGEEFSKAQEQAIQLVRLEISRTAAAATQTERPFDSNTTEIPITEPPPVYNPSAPQPASVSCSQSGAQH
jgi:hypothetical protein